MDKSRTSRFLLTLIIAMGIVLLTMTGCGRRPATQKSAGSGQPAPAPASTALAPAPAGSQKAGPSTPAPGSGGQKTTKITISFSSPSFAFLPAKVAENKGFFKDEGLDVDLIKLAPATVPAALSNGDLDYTLTFTQVVDGVLKGLPFKIIAGMTTKPQHYLIARPELKSVKELKDKVVAVNAAGGLNQVVAEAIGGALGGDPKALRFLVVGDEAARLAMLRQGKIDAITATLPWPIQLKKEGFSILGGPEDLKEGSPASAVSTTEKKIKEKPEEVKKVLRAILKGLKLVQSNRQETMGVMSSWLNLDEATADASYDLMKPTFSTDGKAPQANYATAIRERKQAINADKEVPVSQLVDWSLVEQVQKNTVDH